MPILLGNIVLTNISSDFTIRYERPPHYVTGWRHPKINPLPVGNISPGHGNYLLPNDDRVSGSRHKTPWIQPPIIF